jgi:hypothetical protein
MRWTKHLSRAHKDPKVAELLEIEGIAGFGVYWLLVEEIAEAIGPDSQQAVLVYSPLVWSQKLYVSVRKCKKILETLQLLQLIDCKSIGKRLQIGIPKLLKYRDEYSKKSGVCPDNVPSQIEIEIEIEKQSIELESYQALEKALPPPPLGGEARAKTNPKTDVESEHWGALLSVAALAGLQWSAAIEPKLRAMWAKIPIDERLIAIEGISIRMLGEYADPAYVPKLRRYLEERLWTERTRPPPKKVASIEDRNITALRKLAERVVREGGK